MNPKDELDYKRGVNFVVALFIVICMLCFALSHSKAETTECVFDKDCPSDKRCVHGVCLVRTR